MAKNQSFKRTYIIEAEGITTNDAAIIVLDDFMSIAVKSIDNYYKQVNVKLVEIKEEI